MGYDRIKYKLEASRDLACNHIIPVACHRWQGIVRSVSIILHEEMFEATRLWHVLDHCHELGEALLGRRAAILASDTKGIGVEVQDDKLLS